MTQRRATPFAPVRAALSVAAAWAAAACVWLVAGPVLPGGRWLSVHLFTLGVVTNLLAELMPHFSTSLLHVREAAGPRAPRLAARNAAVLLVLVGRVEGVAPLVALGATGVSAEVLLGWRDVRRMRRTALPARHAMLVRAYQRAYGAFLHAALLGGLLGTGVLPAEWYAQVRLAHLHVAILGWAGVPLLATLVFLGPTLLRVRAVDHADRHARRLLPVAAYGVTGASLALLAGLERVAALGVAAFAVAATVVAYDVVTVQARAAAPSPTLTAALGWLVAAAWADAALLAGGGTAYLDVAGVMALLGGVAPVVLAAGAYLWAMSAGADARERLGRLRATARWAAARGLLWHGGCAVAVAGLVARGRGAELPVPPRWGAYAVAAAVALTAAAATAPARRGQPASRRRTS